MRLSEKMVSEGSWLLRNRKFLPIILFLLIICSMWIKRYLYNQEYLWYDILCLAVTFSGELIRIIARGYSANRTSERYNQEQVLTELDTTGLYSIIRNPLYLGTFLVWIGIAMFTYVYWLLSLFCLIFWLYYERILVAEEEYLASIFGNEYTDYTTKVASFIPSLKEYKPPKYKFSLQNVLHWEITGFYGIIVSFFVIEIIKELLAGGRLHNELFWIVFAVIGTAVFLILSFLKKEQFPGTETS
jgi:protein-S-isoprenylcysteine O-methyltransferase Ste14